MAPAHISIKNKLLLDWTRIASRAVIPLILLVATQFEIQTDKIE